MSAVAVMEFPTLRKAFMLIAGDNGFINRCNPDPVSPFIETLKCELKPSFLEMVETELAKLTDGQLETACCGEDLEQRALDLHPDVTWLFNAFFEEA